jgi:hypothetical protein
LKVSNNMGLIYVEFRSRRPSAELQLFHGVTARKHNTWNDQYPEDIEVLSLARTWRLGPEPEYLTVYHTPASGLERFEEWQRIFRSGEISFMESSAQLAFRIDRAGCYASLSEPVLGTSGPYYVEYFAANDGDGEAVADAFARRRESLGDVTLHLLAARIGLLAPAPGGLAVWGLRDYAQLADIAAAAQVSQAGVEITDAGVYTNTGEETL